MIRRLTPTSCRVCGAPQFYRTLTGSWLSLDGRDTSPPALCRRCWEAWFGRAGPAQGDLFAVAA